MSVFQKCKMEHITPPRPRYSKEAPASGVAAERPYFDEQTLEGLRTGSIERAATLFVPRCAGGDVYENNCAHYLSNAFLLAGADDLKVPHSCIAARCGTSEERPIRARNMHCWFQQKAVRASRKLVKNDGFWAVFQLKEDEYWGGHVAIIDSDKWEYFGTGWYEEWEQYWYKW